MKIKQLKDSLPCKFDLSFADMFIRPAMEEFIRWRKVQFSKLSRVKYSIVMVRQRSEYLVHLLFIVEVSGVKFSVVECVVEFS
jgi:hypothetical protein